MTWVCPESDPEHFILYDLYKIKYDWPINGTVAGYWNSSEGLRIVLTQYKYERRQDMRGAVFEAGLAVSCKLKIIPFCPRVSVRPVLGSSYETT